MTHDFEGLPAELLVAFPLWNPEAMCILGGSSSLRSYLQKRHFWTKSLLKMLLKNNIQGTHNCTQENYS